MYLQAKSLQSLEFYIIKSSTVHSKDSFFNIFLYGYSICCCWICCPDFCFLLLCRSLELGLSLFQPLLGLPHALCLLLYRVRRLCWFQKGNHGCTALFAHRIVILGKSAQRVIMPAQRHACVILLQGVMPRVYETTVVLLLLSLLVLGIVWVASALLHDNIARESLYGGCVCQKALFFLMHCNINSLLCN